MAIQKEEFILCRETNKPKVTPINYWRYIPMKDAGNKFKFISNLTIGGNGLTDENLTPIAQSAIVVIFHGYYNEESREAAKNGNFAPDYIHEFLIYDREERTEIMRAATEEQQAELGVTEVLDRVEKEVIADYANFMAVLNGKKEAITAYNILKNNPAHGNFFEGSIDC